MKLPNDREDMGFLDNQPNLSKEEIIENASELLEWCQDPHWGTYLVIIPLLQPLVNEIKEEIFEVLRGNDIEWADSLIAGFFIDNKTRIDDDMYDFLEAILPEEEQDWNGYFMINKALKQRNIDNQS
jgi:hypothetical protein